MTDATPTETTDAPLSRDNVLDFAQEFSDANPNATLRELLEAMRDAGYQPSSD